MWSLGLATCLLACANAISFPSSFDINSIPLPDSKNLQAALNIIAHLQCDNGELNGVLCYPKCQPGYTGVGPVCWENCPPSYTDIGASCTHGGSVVTKDSYGRGVGTVPQSCPSSHPSRDAALCYPNCRSGYHGVGPVCWQICPSGYRDHGATCFRSITHFFGKRSYGRGAGVIANACAQGSENQAGLCYPVCSNGFSGVGPVCWASCAAPHTIDDGALCREPLDVRVKSSYGRGVGTPPRDSIDAGCTLLVETAAMLSDKSTLDAIVAHVPKLQAWSTGYTGVITVIGVTGQQEIGVAFHKDGRAKCYSTTCLGVETQILSIGYAGTEKFMLNFDDLASRSYIYTVTATIAEIEKQIRVVVETDSSNTRVTSFGYGTLEGVGIIPITGSVNRCTTHVATPISRKMVPEPGYLADSTIAYADVVESVEEAQSRCNLDPSCTGFTFQNDPFPKLVSFSQSAEASNFVAAPSWTTYSTHDHDKLLQQSKGLKSNPPAKLNSADVVALAGYVPVEEGEKIVQVVAGTLQHAVELCRSTDGCLSFSVYLDDNTSALTGATRLTRPSTVQLNFKAADDSTLVTGAHSNWFSYNL
eukprot:c52567_g1_i1.p1 GENE.c52567_g1_i1~~c52567_g1_i1.p1  ORF type:complete len:589 (+),score=89.73 c52567_g1_i1:44-1810(+)